MEFRDTIGSESHDELVHHFVRVIRIGVLLYSNHVIDQVDVVLGARSHVEHIVLWII